MMKPVIPTLALVALALTSATGDASAQTRRARELTPLETLTAANRAARQRPTAETFQEARQIYAYEPGALYEVYTSPNYITTVLLEPGETLRTIAAGDTSRWMVTQADAEGQIEGRTIVLIKPQAVNLRTNVVLITDRRSYLIEAISQRGDAYSAQVVWTYPEGVQLEGAAPLDALNLSYRIRTVRGRRPVWTPTRAFDDGRRTWIEFAQEASSSDLPPLFAVTGEGAELVNYRVLDGPLGKRYMIDRIIDVGELRLGTRSPTIVRIERNPVDRRAARRSRR
jgi:type IV secretion system protein VirB9